MVALHLLHHVDVVDTNTDTPTSAARLCGVGLGCVADGFGVM